MIRPAMITKKEYQSRVSPIVLRGGRSRECHMPPIKNISTQAAAIAMQIAHTRRWYKANRADTISSSTAGIAK